MGEVIQKILYSVLEALYQELFASVFVTCIFMVAFLYLEEHGIKKTLSNIFNRFKKDSKYRKVAFLAFYTMMILYRTLLCRSVYGRGPLADVIGTWTLYTDDGALYTENIENLVLFIPFTILKMDIFGKRLVNKNKVCGYIIMATVSAFVVSLSIELLQLFLRVGTFQLSDLFFNTLGGFIGGVINYVFYCIRHRKDS